LRRSQAAKSRELRQTLELFLKMQAAREKRKTLTTESTEVGETRKTKCANEADSGSRACPGEARQGTVEEDLEFTTDPTARPSRNPRSDERLPLP
jgi:hypothetical protein